MEDYFKKMPILLSLATGIIMGMFFLYYKKVFTEVFHIVIFSSLIVYVFARIFKVNMSVIYDDYIEKKNFENSENNASDKEGNSENMENNKSENNKSENNPIEPKLDLKVEGNSDEFVEFASQISKE